MNRNHLEEKLKRAFSARHRSGSSTAFPSALLSCTSHRQ